MFVVDVHYIAPLEEVDRALADHVTFLQEGYAKGVFLASGRKIPRTGGVILAGNVSREELDAILDGDPFKQRGIAVYTVTEFVASMTALDLVALKEV